MPNNGLLVSHFVGYLVCLGKWFGQHKNVFFCLRNVRKPSKTTLCEAPTAFLQPETVPGSKTKKACFKEAHFGSDLANSTIMCSQRHNKWAGSEQYTDGVSPNSVVCVFVGVPEWSKKMRRDMRTILFWFLIHDTFTFRKTQCSEFCYTVRTHFIYCSAKLSRTSSRYHLNIYLLIKNAYGINNNLRTSAPRRTTARTMTMEAHFLS